MQQLSLWLLPGNSIIAAVCAVVGLQCVYVALRTHVLIYNTGWIFCFYPLYGDYYNMA